MRVSGVDDSAGPARARGFDDFYAATAPSTVRALDAMTGDLAEAQDVVQEAHARAWQRWGSVGRYDVPEAWVRTVAWRLAVSRARRARVGVRRGPGAQPSATAA